MLETNGFPYFKKMNKAKTNVDCKQLSFNTQTEILKKNPFHCCLKLLRSDLKASKMFSYENIWLLVQGEDALLPAGGKLPWAWPASNGFPSILKIFSAVETGTSFLMVKWF